MYTPNFLGHYMMCEEKSLQDMITEMHRSSAHPTKPDTQDVKKVMAIVMKHKLLISMGNREHRTFPTMALNPLAKWDAKKTVEWITAKKKEYLKYKGKIR